jgi:hypothetical protein
MKPGGETGAFGEEITKKYGRENIIYYDHGDKNKNKNVFACKGFYGTSVGNVNRLADIDLFIADSDGNVKVLIEIEERESSPKKIIGDIFSIAMCNQVGVAINKKNSTNFQITKETYLIIGGVIPTQGNRKDKIENIIKERIKIFKHDDEDCLDLNKVELYFDGKIESALARIRLKLNDLLL